MTFLQLVQRTRRECGIAGSGPTTTVNQSGEMARLVDWVQQSWVEIQEEQPDWDFLRNQVSFLTQHGTAQGAGDSVIAGNVYELVTVGTTDFDAIGEIYTGTANSPGAVYLITTTTTLGAGDSTQLYSKNTYTVGSGADIDLADFAAWRNSSFRSYRVADGVGTEIYLGQYPAYSEFRDYYLLGSRKLVVGRPRYITVEPRTRSLVLGFAPDAVYRVTAEYYRTPQVLAVDADEPIMPERYHMAIVYKAMQKYGLYEVAAEQIEAGRQGYTTIINRMRQEYLPQIVVDGSFL